MQFQHSNILQYGGGSTKTKYKCDLGYFHATYEVNPGAYSIPRSPRTPVIPLAGLEMSKATNYQILSNRSAHCVFWYLVSLQKPVIRAFNCSITIVV